MSLPEYTFVPWLRRGLAAEIDEADRFGAQPEAGTVGRPTLDVELTLDVAPAPGAPTPPRPTIKRDVQILGPGDVAGLKGEAILRTHPRNGVLGATPDELAFVEFYDEDLPWRYSPARAASARLRPWLALLVLTDEEFTLQDRGEGALPLLTFADGALLPPVEETWAWAHAQLSVAVADAAKVGAEIEKAPDHARSRLLSPRRLEGGRQYHAFLVPAFEAGRLAGLGRQVEGVPAQKPAWGLALHAADREMPVYHRFSFRTSTEGDFETLARRLVPRAAGPEFGIRTLDVAEPGFGAPARAGATVGFEGALAPPKFAPVPFAVPWDDDAEKLQLVLDASDAALRQAPLGDPVVVPPAYGLKHKGVPRVLDARNAAALAWLAELNLDYRNRAAAGLGTEVVRQRQEELMQRAWEQVGRIEEANQRLREAELARAAAERVMRKHLEPVKAQDRLTLLTAIAQPGLPVTGALPVVAATGPVAPDQVPPTASLRAAVDMSRVPAAAQSPAFRRMIGTQRPVMRRLARTTASRPDLFASDLLTKMDVPAGALTVAPAPAVPGAVVELATIQTAVSVSVGELTARPPRPFEVFLQLAADEVASRPQGTNFNDAVELATMKSALATRVRNRFPLADFINAPPALGTLERGTWDLVQAIDAVAADGPGRAKLTIDEATFLMEFSDDALGKAHGPVTAVRGGVAPAGATIGRTTSAADAQKYQAGLNAFQGMQATRKDPDPARGLGAGLVQSHVLDALDPVSTLGERIGAAIPFVAARDPALDLGPVMAYPEFPDPLMEPLRALSQDHVIPNVSDLPRESLTVMEPNRRFIESYLVGANFAFNQELLWREYPTDQRGSPFRVFWDARDAAVPGRVDITPVDEWSGALGAQAPSPAGVLVLVVRGELLERFPNTVIYAQRAKFATAGTQAARVLDPAVPVKDPIFAGELEPDIRLVGFQLSVAEARGRREPDRFGAPADPGWFFVFMERPGEPRFGLDSAAEPPALETWDSLAWSHLAVPAAAPGSPFVHLAGNEALVPSEPVTATWGVTAADQASILLQSPVLLARHASEMLP